MKARLEFDQGFPHKINRGKSKTDFCCAIFNQNCRLETRFRNSIFSIVTFSVVELWRVEEVLPSDVAAGDPHGLRDDLGGDHDLEWKTIEKDLKKTKKMWRPSSSQNALREDHVRFLLMMS